MAHQAAGEWPMGAGGQNAGFANIYSVDIWYRGCLNIPLDAQKWRPVCSAQGSAPGTCLSALLADIF